MNFHAGSLLEASGSETGALNAGAQLLLSLANCWKCIARNTFVFLSVGDDELRSCLENVQMLWECGGVFKTQPVGQASCGVQAAPPGVCHSC